MRPPGTGITPGSLAASGRWISWALALLLMTVALLGARPLLDKAHVALLYVLLVLLASARAGRRVGLALCVGAFICFNYFFVPPYHTLRVAEPIDWLVLASFLIVSGVAAQLLTRARDEADAARARAVEIDRLSAVGAEALNAARADEALAAVTEVTRAALGVSRCEVFGWKGDDGELRCLTDRDTAPAMGEAGYGLGPTQVIAQGAFVQTGMRAVAWAAAHGRVAVERADSVDWADGTPAEGDSVASLESDGITAVAVPLLVADRMVGVLSLAHDSPMHLAPAQRRFLDAMTYYAALGAERLRLVAETEHVETLRQADALKDALLASVSHDLRTPLTTIKALAHAIRREGDERAATIEEEADRLNRLVADLLDLSRLAGGALQLTPEINAAEDLLGAALQQVSGHAGDREIAVHLDPTEPLLLGLFDFVHALRIVVNLLENALKYTPDGSPIELAARGAAGMLEIEVADRGPGIPAGDSLRVFEAFFRPAGQPADGRSAGLGLSISRQLAEAQGGSLLYEPRAGGGSRFMLRLPAADVSGLEMEASSL